MTNENTPYVTRAPQGSWRITGTRISLDSIVHAYWDGQPAETIITDFPSLTLEQVYGAIAFYLQHRAEIDAYMSQQQSRSSALRSESESRNKPLLDRLRQLRKSATPA